MNNTGWIVVNAIKGDATATREEILFINDIRTWRKWLEGDIETNKTMVYLLPYKAEDKLRTIKIDESWDSFTERMSNHGVIIPL